VRAPLSPQPARIGALWLGIQAVWSALLGVFLQAGVAALAPHDDLAVYAWLAASGALVGGAVQVAMGVLSDRRAAVVGHRRESYLAGLALALPALLGFFAAPTLAGLAAAFVAMQVGMNLLIGPYQAAVPDAVDQAAAGRASAWMSAYQFAGSVLGLVVAAAFAGLAAGALLATLLALGFAITFAHLAALPPIAAPASALRLDRDVVTILISRGAINVGFYTLFGFLFFFVRESLGVADPRTTTGLLFVAFTLAGIVGAALAGRPTDREDKRLVVTVAAAAIALAVGAFAAAFTLPVAFGAALAAGAAWGAFFTADWAIAYAVLPRTAMATAMGVWNLAATIPQIIAPLVTAPLVARLDAQQLGLGPRAALVLVIVEFAFGAAWLWRLPPQRGVTSR
jgi:MFS family permease